MSYGYSMKSASDDSGHYHVALDADTLGRVLRQAEAVGVPPEVWAQNAVAEKLRAWLPDVRFPDQKDLKNTREEEAE